ncbi:hypothetical protein TREMEDRAFT_33390 [Tremella mesenterica DSM 1558]|uniref:uncharacterized protein n=1 Tax=Tremella mesenterica (strain ATCC 24925 / CBS 8224 / DSM 1558 / NBRC 9311 / NRRL Y-6157 / RJB 2259-6 / UBC 559-6) TaxID=578456 RepID=UPI0003F49EA4|nr:uncharacterized protein TREMEDRAFT_33390 [Tremella mesenterica DSM 1558]EIW67546.1 hypothetical protein TREMEDRAFT_33390 [Tremella mesenterica DSM 1558]
MVQPNFSNPRKAQAELSSSSTAALDAFLDTQHQSYYEEIYKSEAACLCILRQLPEICRYIILHFIWSHQPVKSSDLKALLRMDQFSPLSQVANDIQPAIKRKIFQPLELQQGKRGHHTPMNDVFKRGLRNALTGSGTSNSFGLPYPLSPTDEYPSESQLIQFGDRTWESILKYMVSSGLDRGFPVARPETSVLRLLHSSGLMADLSESNGRQQSLDRMTITSQGFQFLLEDRQTQLWQILVFYLTSIEVSCISSAPVLSLFFSLGCMQITQSYSLSTFSNPTQLQALDDLQSYGLIYRPATPSGAKADYFFPTHLSTSLCSGNSALSAALNTTEIDTSHEDDKKFLILETNYKIYAYTNNELEIAILNLFMDIKVQYRNLVVGKLDRAHVKAAMEKGISAYQIIAYLQSHAHPQMYSSPPPILHTTIVDQLHLWDKERNRLRTEESEMFEFFSKDLYEDTEAEAKRYDGLLLAVPKDKLLFVNPSVKDAIKDFVKGQQRQLRGM